MSNKDWKDKDIVDGLIADTQVGKKPKTKNLKKCQYKDCKVLIIRGKYCSPHSADRVNDLNRKV